MKRVLCFALIICLALVFLCGLTACNEEANQEEQIQNDGTSVPGSQTWEEDNSGKDLTPIQYAYDETYHWSMPLSEGDSKVAHTFVEGICSVCGFDPNAVGYEKINGKEEYEVAGLDNPNATAVYIPSTHNGLPVTAISDYAFFDCKTIKTITFSNSVKKIGNRSFSGCAELTSVYYTGDIADWCEITWKWDRSNPLICAHNLYINYILQTEIIIPDKVAEIYAYAFEGWNGTSVTISNGVTRIEGSAFSCCYGLTSITIPDSMTFIAGSAFEYCTNLTSITFTGRKSKWRAMYKSNGWDFNTGSYTVYCTDGTVNK